jgi:hypothetical protein
VAGENFQPGDGIRHGDDQRARGDGRPYNVAHRTDMRIDGLGIQIDTTVQLRDQEESREEQRQHVNAL